MSKVWLITGSAGGLGRTIADAVLAAGHRLVATARNVEPLGDLVDRYGAQVRTFRLDVTDEAQGKAAVQTAVDAFGRLDVLVNNAGYGDLRPFEQTPSEDFRRVVETCLFGVVNMTRAALPVMRAQRSGHVIQISSIGGRIGFPGSASYHAAKWAVSGFTESVAQETAPFGVEITALEPGGMRTGFGTVAAPERDEAWPDYEPSVGQFLGFLRSVWGNESGDPARVAQVVLKVAEARRLPAHIILGNDAIEAGRNADRVRAEAAIQWEAISRSIDFSAAGPVPAVPVK
ncbi:NAD(P)-dependent dehydrogenase (short-subunit alcohol dehydrogenase family) [Burkholderia sp. PvR073]|uniref:SDR family NAD(P)-dependent oxidoreductase n=1 Tax=Burkholderia TaxID=32008 RepID=UPI00254C2888|nr:SDR family NAD(P)-dependent oxidoreductase [Burkholderia sp. lyk4-R2A-23]